MPKKKSKRHSAETYNAMHMLKKAAAIQDDVRIEGDLSNFPIRLIHTDTESGKETVVGRYPTPFDLTQAMIQFLNGIGFSKSAAVKIIFDRKATRDVASDLHLKG